jgi:hypothetical protein
MSNIAQIRSSLETDAMRKFYERLDGAITEIALDMGHGNLINSSDSDATAQNYCRAVGIIQGLQRAKDLCTEVEDRLIRGIKV